MPWIFSISFAQQVAIIIFLAKAAELTRLGPALRGIVSQRAFSYPLSRTTKMAETMLVFSASKTSFDPQVQGCLIIGQPRHLQAVSFDHFAEKLSRRVDSEVRSNFHWSWKAQFKSNSIFNFNFGISVRLTLFIDQLRFGPQALICCAAVNRPRFISL